MPSYQHTLFKSWKEALLHHPSAMLFDEHTAKTIIAICNTGDDLTKVKALLSGASAHLAFLTTATGTRNTCLLYHHCERQGSPIIGQAESYMALMGIGDLAIPVCVEMSTLFDVEDKQVPGLAYLKDLESEEKVDLKPPTAGCNTITCTEEGLHSTILLPP
eukprot:4017434-Ditylum_brightwellii.AAC.1